MVAGVIEIKPCNCSGDKVRYPNQIAVPFVGLGIRRRKLKRNVSLYDIDQRNLKPIPDEIVADFVRPIAVGHPAKARESSLPAEQAANIATEQGNDECFAEHPNLLIVLEQLLRVPDVLQHGIEPGDVDRVLSPEFDIADEDVAEIGQVLLEFAAAAPGEVRLAGTQTKC